MANDFVTKAVNYKKYIGSRYIAVESEMITKRMAQFKEYLVSVKYDGHFCALAFVDGQVSLINRTGRVLERLDLHDELEKHFTKKGIKKLFIAGELYLDADVRTRMFNVTSAIASGGEGLKYAAFDLLEIEEQDCRKQSSFEKFEQLKEIFPAKGNFHLVEYFVTDSTKAIVEYFKEKVEIGKAEGIVVKTEGFPIFKVKPKFTFDAVIIGFAQGDGERSDMLRDFLLAFRKEDGSYQIFAHMHHGFNDDERRELLKEYSKMVVPSDYIEVARNRLGFQMVRPEKVIEFTCIDVINEDSKGNILKMNLSYDENKGYIANHAQPTISVTIPLFVKFREDKEATIEETSFEQILDVVSFDDVDVINHDDLPDSEIVRREVYRKESRGSVMVRKFVILKTNKERLKEYPAYVFHYTDFSSGRKDPLKKEVKVSDSEEQIMDIFEEEFLKNIKKGWVEVE